MQTSRSQITVYTRVSCAPCALLVADLDAAGVPYEEVSISGNARAEARAADLNNGSAVTPTVVVGDRVLINPSAGEVVEAASYL